MLSIDDVRGKVAEFKKKHGLQEQDEHVATTIHLMNTHRLDLPAAQDRTSSTSADKGIDGWHFDDKTQTLFVYQSKLSSAKSTALAGFEDLVAGGEWIGTVLETGDLGAKIANNSLYNLVSCLEAKRGTIRSVLFQLISPFDPNELEDCSEVSQSRLDLVKSSINRWVKSRDGRLNLEPAEYNLTSTLPANLTAYDVTSPVDPQIRIGKRTQLEVVFLNLSSLVELFRRRGNRCSREMFGST